MDDRAPGRAAVAAGLLLAVIYGASAARDVTFWDAGEFIAAFATFGIPHPPGTPLFVALGRVWTLAGSLLGLTPAFAAAMLAAVCTASAGACTAWLVARWTRSGACGLAAALCAGSMTTVWASATEAEVYGVALALACASLVAAEHAGVRLRVRTSEAPTAAGRTTGERSKGSRVGALTAYALALAVPLHLSALAVSPAAVWLACVGPRDGARDATQDANAAVIAWRRAVALVGAVLSAVGVGTAHVTPLIVGVGVLIAAVAIADPGATDRASAHRDVLAIGGATALALTGTLILLVRARHDPWLNQGDPSTWARLVDVIGRRQYAVAPLWPRQAPWWLQIANLGEWADWQVALGLAPGPEPAWARTPITVAYALLGTWGARTHWRVDRRSWMAVLVLLVAGSIGLVAYLNLKAGPSFGEGVLPETALHEARERDYFFVLAWWAWGIWAGLGATALARRLTVPSLGVALAALPFVLNWSTSTRTRPPAARAAAIYAAALLENAPPQAVLLVAGDNDLYPLWAAQAVHHTRPDVTPVSVSLLPARWYRAELARRNALLPSEVVAAWRGTEPTVAAIATRTTTLDRPVAVSLATDDATRRAVANGRGTWALRGLVLAWIPPPRVVGAAGRSTAADLVLPAPIARLVGTVVGNRAALVAASLRAPVIEPAWLHDGTGDGVVAWAYRQLVCPAAALGAAPRSLEGACRAR